MRRDGMGRDCMRRDGTGLGNKEVVSWCEWRIEVVGKEKDGTRWWVSMKR